MALKVNPLSLIEQPATPDRLELLAVILLYTCLSNKLNRLFVWVKEYFFLDFYDFLPIFILLIRNSQTAWSVENRAQARAVLNPTKKWVNSITFNLKRKELCLNW